MNRSVQLLVALAVFSLALAGCADSGPATATVNGTLIINGEPANGVNVTFVPTDSTLPTASGPVTNGAFELFSGVKGKPGAAPGRYKVVLTASSSGSAEADAAAYESTESGPPPEKEAPFPEKYGAAGTSDKEVEVTSGTNNIKIEISDS